MSEPAPGVVLSERYRLDSVLGRGGMATVWRATQIDLDRPVAIKILAPGDGEDPTGAARFEREGRLVSRLAHPGSVRVFDFGRVGDGRAYLVMELLEGRTLADRMRSDGPMDWRDALVIIRDVADALAEAHAAGVVHRDLKPANIFLQRVADREVVKVLDYGIARWAASSVRTQTGEVFGTPSYMSPEQAQGLGVDGRSDLYSLGVLLYQCLQGAPPFQADSPLGVLYLHVQEPPPPLTVEAPAAVRELLASLLAKSPKLRPATASVARDHATALLSGDPPPARAPVRWPWLIAAAAAVWGLLHLWPAPAPPPTAPATAPSAPADVAPVQPNVPAAEPSPARAPETAPAAGPAPAPAPERARKPKARRARSVPPPAKPDPPATAKPKGPPPGFIRVIDQSETE